MVQIPNRLEFPTESYDDFSGQWSAERVLFRMSKTINRLVFCCKQIREKRKSVRKIEDIV
jgi:hypothetical protein